MLATLQPSGISPELSELEQHMIKPFQFLSLLILAVFEDCYLVLRPK